jgi:hypothetical protein
MEKDHSVHHATSLARMKQSFRRDSHGYSLQLDSALLKQFWLTGITHAKA